MSINLDCRGMLNYLLTKIGIYEEKIDIHEAKKRLDIEAQRWTTEYVNNFWSQFNHPSKLNQQLPHVITKFEQEGIQTGLAIDLGCGNSSSALYLLGSGWKVIAVDCTQAALTALRNRANEINPDWIRKKELTLVCTHMEKFKFPENVQLIVANDSLNYCNPSELTRVWQNAQDALAKGGRIVGNFFIAPWNQMAENIGRFQLGGWYSDKAVVDALLDHFGYEKELCACNKKWYEPDPRHIEFIGKKA